MKHSRPIASLGVLSALAIICSVSAADTDALSLQAKACDDNVMYFRGKIDGVVTWTNSFMIAGAIIAALGSAFAGFLSKENLRRTAAVLGALGAVITVLPKTLPDKEVLQAHLSAAEKHRVLGAKVRNQLAFAAPDESILQAQKYSSARFTDCASVDPPTAAPDLPTPTPVPLSTTVSANVPAEFVAATAPAPSRPPAFSATKAPPPKPIPKETFKPYVGF